MKLDVNVLRYLGKDDFRTLTAVEMGQKNVSLPYRCADCSELISMTLIEIIYNLM